MPSVEQLLLAVWNGCGNLRERSILGPVTSFLWEQYYKNTSLKFGQKLRTNWKSKAEPVALLKDVLLENDVEAFH